MEAITTLEENGFEVSAAKEGQLFNIRSKATGAYIERCATLDALKEYARCVVYALSKDVDNAWKRPLRETGRYLIS